MKADGSDVQRLTNRPGPDGGPFFSWDGKLVAFRGRPLPPGPELDDYRALLEGRAVAADRARAVRDGSRRQQPAPGHEARRRQLRAVVASRRQAADLRVEHPRPEGAQLRRLPDQPRWLRPRARHVQRHVRRLSRCSRPTASIWCSRPTATPRWKVRRTSSLPTGWNERSGRARGGRPAAASDAAAITRIYNQGIADGTATFETRLRDRRRRAWPGSAGGFRSSWSRSDGEVVAFASTSEYRPRECYAGIAEFSVYVAASTGGHGRGPAGDGDADRGGAGARASGSWSRGCSSRTSQAARCCATSGFARSASTSATRGSADAWKDVVIVERLLAE